MLKDNLQRRGLLFPILPYLNFLVQKIPSKRMMWSKRCLWRIFHFNSEKSLTFAICGECVVKSLVLQLCPHV